MGLGGPIWDKIFFKVGAQEVEEKTITAWS